MTPEPWVECCDTDVLFMAEQPDSCFSLHLDQLPVSGLIAISTGSRILCWYLRETLMWGLVHYSHSKKICKNVLVTHWFLENLTSFEYNTSSPWTISFRISTCCCKQIHQRLSRKQNKTKQNKQTKTTEASLHHAHYFQLELRPVLKQWPWLTSAAVQVFYLWVCPIFKIRFSPQTGIIASVTFAKCLCAQLIQERFMPD